MRMPDVNVLIYAHRRDDEAHAVCREYLERLAAGPEPFALSALVAVAFVRIVTNSKFPPRPTPLTKAVEVIDALHAVDGCRWLSPGHLHWEVTRKLCLKARCQGKLVADAQHAALAMEHGCTWVTRDADFRRFVPLGLKLEML